MHIHTSICYHFTHILMSFLSFTSFFKHVMQLSSQQQQVLYKIIIYIVFEIIAKNNLFVFSTDVLSDISSNISEKNINFSCCGNQTYNKRENFCCRQNIQPYVIPHKAHLKCCGDGNILLCFVLSYLHNLYQPNNDTYYKIIVLGNQIIVNICYQYHFHYHFQIYTL